jgi:hypothetical protein
MTGCERVPQKRLPKADERDGWTVYVTVHVRIPKTGERTQFHTQGLGKNPRKYWILVKSGIADRAYKAAALMGGPKNRAS